MLTVALRNRLKAQIKVWFKWPGPISQALSGHYQSHQRQAEREDPPVELLSSKIKGFYLSKKIRTGSTCFKSIKKSVYNG